MLTIIVSTLFISLVLNVFLKKLNLPTIIGYIITGTIIAYGFGLHDAVHNHELKEIAEFGVVFLMFTIGLEFSIEHLKKMKYEVFVAGTLQIFITAIITFLISNYIFEINTKISLIIALAIALSSTAIVLKTFNESGDINKRFGQRALGILIMQDIAVIPILLIIGFMSNTADNISNILIQMLFSAVILLTLLWFMGKYLLEPFFNQVSKTNSDEIFIGTILFLAIGASYLAHVLGFSYSLGAFIAGMLIAETKYKHQAEAELVPFRDILLGVFFITVGMQIDFIIIFSYVHIIFALLIAVMILKFFIIYAIIRLNETKAVSFKTALSLVQIGEFSLALLELARSNSLIGPPYGQVMIVTIVISMIITPLILHNLQNIQKIFIKDDHTNTELEVDSALLKDHTVIIGFGNFGHEIAQNLKNIGEIYIAIESNIENYHKAQHNNEPIIFGNGAKKNILHHANIEHAKTIIIAINNANKLYNLCNTIKKFVDVDKIIVKVHSQKEKKIIENLGINKIIIETTVASEALLGILEKKA